MTTGRPRRHVSTTEGKHACSTCKGEFLPEEMEKNYRAPHLPDMASL